MYVCVGEGTGYCEREQRDNIITVFKSFEIATLNSALVVKCFFSKSGNEIYLNTGNINVNI